MYNNINELIDAFLKRGYGTVDEVKTFYLNSPTVKRMPTDKDIEVYVNTINETCRIIKQNNEVNLFRLKPSRSGLGLF